MVVAVVAGPGLLEKVDNISGTTSKVSIRLVSRLTGHSTRHIRVQSRHKSLKQYKVYLLQVNLFPQIFSVYPRQIRPKSVQNS
jgi:hypothetical protein